MYAYSLSDAILSTPVESGSKIGGRSPARLHPLGDDLEAVADEKEILEAGSEMSVENDVEHW